MYVIELRGLITLAQAINFYNNADYTYCNFFFDQSSVKR